MKNVQRTLALAICCGIVCFVCRAFGMAMAYAFVLSAALCVSVFFYIFFSFGRNAKRSTAAAAFTAAFCVAGILLGGAIISRRASAEAYVSEDVHVVKAVVKEVGFTADYSADLTAEIFDIDGEKVKLRAKMSFPFDPLLYENDEFSAVGNFERIEKYTSIYDSDGVFVAFSACECEYLLSEKESVFYKIRVFGSKLSEKLSSLIGGDEGRVASAIVLGDKSGLSPKLKLDFRRSGASHILAVSGMHLSVLVMFLRFLLMPVKKKKRNAVLIVISLGYMTLTGFSPSVCRAAIMTSVFLAAEIFGEESDGITALFVSMAIILSVSPVTVYNTGFWLSCLATLGILIVVPAFGLKFLNPKENDKTASLVIKRVARNVLTLIIASASAQMFTLLVIFASFGGISAFSLMSGMILIPIAEAALILSTVTCVFSFVPFVSVAFAATARLPLSAMIFTAKRISSVSGAYISIRHPFVIYIIAVGTVITLAIVFIKKIDKKFIMAVGAVEVAAFCVCLAVFGFITRGQSDMIYSVNGTNESIAVSARGNVFVFDISNGGYSALGDAVENVNEIYLEEIDYAVLTHLHQNHISSVRKLVSSIKVDNILLPTAESENDAYVIRSIRTVVGNDVNIMFYNRASESEISVDGLIISLPTNAALKRSTHPLIAFYIEENGHRVTYLGASCAETDDAHVNEIYLNSDCLIVGVHGPKVKGKFDIKTSAAKTVVFGGDANLYASTSGFEGDIISAAELGGTVKIRFENK